MRNSPVIVVLLTVLLSAMAVAEDSGADSARDILVTFANEGANSVSSGISEPYRKRKRYSIVAQARRHAAEIAADYALIEVDRWPIRSLSVFCFIYRVSSGLDRENIVGRLRADPRVESAQLVQRFETVAGPQETYDDTYANLQRGLDVMEISAAHRYSRGQGVRVAIVDGHADVDHEDLKGRVTSTRVLAHPDKSPNGTHGTAVASVIGANANNARGMVGIAPAALMELYVACWAEEGEFNAVCDSFTLAKALDAVLENTADILNLSLVGPYDPLLERLLKEVEQAGVVIVAARSPRADERNRFPASFEGVIGVSSSDAGRAASSDTGTGAAPLHVVYAPGEQIMVAVPDDAYDFRSGTSLSAAHVSGVVALLLAVSPSMPARTVQSYLRDSQYASESASPSVNACIVLQMANSSRQCQADAPLAAGPVTIRKRTSH
ncbi:MAG TPA: S8 family serine peptidase [Woeseiaceae bacterium]